MCGFCNVWVCVCVDFVMCGCVCVDFAISGCVYLLILKCVYTCEFLNVCLCVDFVKCI